MGLSVRTDSYRYSEWFRWQGDMCSPNWNVSDGVELYSHIGDNVPACFDCFENVNLAGTAAGRQEYAEIIASHRVLLLAHFKNTHALSCPPQPSAEELAGIDPTYERLDWLL